MRFSLLLLAAWLLCMVIPSNASAPAAGGPYAAQWKKIDALLSKDQTAAAEKLVLDIYQKARAGRQPADHVRALTYRLHLLERREEDADVKGIKLLEEDLRSATFPARPLLHSLLAQEYHQYLRQNRYRLYDRTQVQPVNDELGVNDLQTWDAARLAAQVVRHYRASVESETARQQQTTLRELGQLVTPADAAGQQLRPTLYDLLVHRAIEGLNDDELYLTRPAEQFRFTDARLLGAEAEFLALPLTAPAADSLNGPWHALRLWQQLTRFRQAGPAAARADVERLRLAFVYQHAAFPDKTKAYEAALRRAAGQYAALSAWADFQAELAELARQQNRPTEAMTLAREAVKRFSKSVGGQRAQALINELEQPELSVQTTEVQLPDEPLLLNVGFRNLKQAHGFAWKLPAAAVLRELTGQRETEIPKAYAKRLATAPAATWALALPGPTDYRSHRAELAGPKLAPGHYLLAVSSAAAQPTKQRANVTTVYAFVSVSELGSVHRAAPTGGTDLWTVNRRSGQPEGGVTVQPWYQQYLNGKTQHVAGSKLTTAADGHLTVPVEAGQRRYMQALLLSRGRDSLVLGESLGGYRPPLPPEAERVQRRAFVYTDRAIYRPGQTLYFKGILAEEQKGRSQVSKNVPLRVRLLDVNGQQVLELPFTTSDFGSFHGSVTLPTGLLNGEMQLTVQTTHFGKEEWLGRAGFAVEDYKRPTFFVTLDPVGGTPKLGDTLSVRGTATAYAGQAIDGAQVQYRVVRRTVWPMFGWHELDFGFGREGSGGGMRRPYFPGGGEQQQIASGTVTTDEAGRFRVAFTATPPDEALNEEDRNPDDEDGGYRPPRPGRPTYVFEVTADVTDPNGETRSQQRGVSLGGPALNLSLSGPREVNQANAARAPFAVRSQNATGEAVPATGTLRLYRLTPPARTLRPRFGPRPDQPGLSREQHQQLFPLDAWLREDDPATWPRTVAGEWKFDTQHSGELPEMVRVLTAQAPGAYLLEAQSVLGADTAKARLGFTLYSPTAAQPPLPVPSWLVSLQDSVAPGQAAQLLIGTGFEQVQARLEVESQGQLLRAEWLTLRREQRAISLPTAAANAGPLHVRLVFVHAGRFYQREVTVQVAEPVRPLRLDISTFRDKLQPGQKETWRVTIRNSQNQPAAAELLASLYDQSLDYFRPHAFERPELPQPYVGERFNWSARFGAEQWETLFAEFSGKATGQQYYLYPGLRLDYWDWANLEKRSAVKFTPPVIKRDEEGMYGAAEMTQSVKGNAGRAVMRMSAPVAPPPLMAPGAEMKMSADAAGLVEEESAAGNAVSAQDGQKPTDLASVPVRADFRETAMWMPAVRTNAQGEVVLEFQMPEAVTRWQLLTLAHTPDLQTGLLARQLVTQKELMVTPNAPRFFREGDQLRFSAKISNLSGQALSGTAQLLLFDARTNQPLDKQLLQSPAQVAFNTAASQSTTATWDLSIPAGLEAVTYRVVASGQLAVDSKKLSGQEKKARRKAKKQTTDNSQLSSFSDGEENTLPVLPNRLLVLEAVPLAVRGNTTREFELKKLTSTSSPTRQNQSLTLELTANPAWYAVQALPYLMEYPYECSEQVFSRLYANTLAARIVQQNPRIRPVLDEWKKAAASGDPNALRSKLEQNQELKALLLQETPWVREGQSDTERMRRLADLFDEARLQAETQRAVQKLAELQSPSGAFPWFKQMPDNRYITQLIVAGFGRLRKLGAFDARQDARTADVLRQAVAYLDREIQREYDQLRKRKNVKLTDDHLGDATLHALYARSFWTAELPLPAASKTAYDYYRTQAGQHWLKRNRYLQGLAAITLHRAGQTKPARDIMEALRQNALQTDELGMYWKDVRAGFYWQQAPTETQTQLIEAFNEVSNDQKAVEEMKLWLLAQKRTHNWESTRATADACYALLLQGSRNWLEPTKPLQVTLGGQALNTTEGAEAGTGYLKRSFPAAEVKPAMGKVRVQKTDAGVAWGGLYWQYFEQLDKITRADNAPLGLTRQLFRETTGASGPVLTPMTTGTPLKVGEVLVVRLVLKTDRELEFVHLKDTRAAGLELIGQTSGYRYQQGLGYYESPRDAATNFFMDVLPRGTHVFEYRLRAAQAGDFSSGISQVQCLYAPDFTSHSAGQRLKIGGQ
ncbi:alpha-2-macroglobulin family protein [Hymenobacter sp. B81]|uniref:alpha-2-macroglobulin family protein n=1 Tax=Hymenobacter sp. B81 TaxID=3344878 RepID=UPI0037DCEA45